MNDRIVAADIFTLVADVPPFSDARHNIPAREAMWVRLQTAEGLHGWGEAAVWGGPSPVTATIIADELFPLLGGEDPNKIHYLWEKCYQQTAQHGRRGAVVAAMGALDIALWDIMAKRSQQPLVNLLGRMSDRITPYASAGFYAVNKSVDDLQAEYKRLSGFGFRAFKMKVGRQRRRWSAVWDRPDTTTLDQDVERVYAVRDTIGPDAILLIDANTEWDTVTTVTFLRAVEDAKPFFMEEPVSADLYNQAAEIRSRVNIRLAGFETEYTRFAYRELLSAGAVDVVQPDPCWCGGLSEARRIAAMASAWGRVCVPHSFSSALSFLINTHFVASLDNGFLVEWDSSGNPWIDQLIRPEQRLNDDGTFDVPDGPGIGFEPDVDSLDGSIDVQTVTADRRDTEA
jgi:L-alanine-DL-glutamate epimerase-like enolase superfamily enzyme